MALKELLNKTIHKVLMDLTGDHIEFVTDEGSINYYAQSGCCSESWINHISGIKSLIGQKVIKVDDIEMDDTLMSGDAGFSNKQSCETVYRYLIYTAEGMCEIDFRNASNGYYGGSLKLCSETKYYKKEILEDF